MKDFLNSFIKVEKSLQIIAAILAISFVGYLGFNAMQNTQQRSVLTNPK